MNTSNNNHPMSLTKRNPAFDRMMEEQRELDDLSYEYYAEELYLNSRKARMPVDDEQPEPKPATTVAQQPKR